MWNHLVRVRGLFLVFMLLVNSLAAYTGVGTQQHIPFWGGINLVPGRIAHEESI